MSRVEIVAHRGASADAPENTLAAIQLAWQLNADAAEIDVMLTADGQLVAIHDESTLRTTGVDWVVKAHSLAELKSLDAGSWKSSQFVGEQIPTLSEVLDIVPVGKRLFIELKCGTEAFPELLRVLSAAKTTREQTVLISLDLDVIAAAKRAIPNRHAFWVTEQSCLVSNRPTELHPTTQQLIEQAKMKNLDGLDINDLATRPSGDIATIRRAGLRTCVWTVNTIERARWLCDEGIESLTTDVPEALRAI